MNTFHCNNCLILLSRSNDKFRGYLTNCQHIFCEKCKEECMEKCRACGRICDLLEINDKMPPSARLLFTSVDNIREIMKTAMKFQKKQTLLYIRRSEQIEKLRARELEKQKQKLENAVQGHKYNCYKFKRLKFAYLEFVKSKG